jgi:hypothetical protein
MFNTFLIGTALVTGLILLVLLVQPKPATDVGADKLPYVGMTLAFLLAVLAIIGGLAVAS